MKNTNLPPGELKKSQNLGYEPISRRNFIGTLAKGISALVGATIMPACEINITSPAEAKENFLTFQGFARIVLAARRRSQQLKPLAENCGDEQKCGLEYADSIACLRTILEIPCEGINQSRATEPLNFAEGIKYICQVFGLDQIQPKRSSENVKFNYKGDYFSSDFWYYDFLKILYGLELIEEELTFSPANSINQAELEKLLDRILQL